MLCDMLDVSDPAAVLPEVQALQEENPGGATAAEEVKEAFREMREQLKGLRGRNEELLDRLEAPPKTPASSSDGLHPKTESLLEQLGLVERDRASSVCGGDSSVGTGDRAKENPPDRISAVGTWALSYPQVETCPRYPLAPAHYLGFAKPIS